MGEWYHPTKPQFVGEGLNQDCVEVATPSRSLREVESLNTLWECAIEQRGGRWVGFIDRISGDRKSFSRRRMFGDGRFCEQSFEWEFEPTDTLEEAQAQIDTYLTLRTDTLLWQGENPPFSTSEQGGFVSRAKLLALKTHPAVRALYPHYEGTTP